MTVVAIKPIASVTLQLCFFPAPLKTMHSPIFPLRHLLVPFDLELGLNLIVALGGDTIFVDQLLQLPLRKPPH